MTLDIITPIFTNIIYLIEIIFVMIAPALFVGYFLGISNLKIMYIYNCIRGKRTEMRVQKIRDHINAKFGKYNN